MKSKFTAFVSLMGLMLLSVIIIWNIITDNDDIIIPPPKDDSLQVKHTKINTIKMFLEVSKSMKGYVYTHEDFGDYKMKEVLPKIVTTLNKLYDIKLYTVSGEIIPYQKTLPDLIEELKSGSIFREGSSELHKMIESILDSTDSNNVSIFITDCIPYLRGNFSTPQNRHLLQNYIYEASSKKEFSVLVFQYLSDFNGRYYYDFNNRQPYYREKLLNRPFYFFAFGQSMHLREILNKNIFQEEDYNQSASFSLQIDKVNYQILPYKLQGKLIIKEKYHRVEVNQDVSESDSIAFTIGLNLSSFPNYIRQKEYLDSNLVLDKYYLPLSIRTYPLEEIINDKKFLQIAEKVDELGLTHFVNLNLKMLARDNNNYLLQLKLTNPKWIEECNVLDDTGLSLEEIEGKTFLLSSVLGGLSEPYKNRDILFQIPFTIIPD